MRNTRLFLPVMVSFLPDCVGVWDPSLSSGVYFRSGNDGISHPGLWSGKQECASRDHTVRTCWKPRQ